MDIQIPLSANEVERISRLATVVFMHRMDEANIMDAISIASYVQSAAHRRHEIVVGSGNPMVMNPWNDIGEKIESVANAVSESPFLTPAQLQTLSDAITEYQERIPHATAAMLEEYAKADERQMAASHVLEGARHSGMNKWCAIRDGFDQVEELVAAKKAQLSEMLKAKQVPSGRLNSQQSGEMSV